MKFASAYGYWSDWTYPSIRLRWQGGTTFSHKLNASAKYDSIRWCSHGETPTDYPLMRNMLRFVSSNPTMFYALVRYVCIYKYLYLFIYICIYTMDVLQRRTVCMLIRGLFWCWFPELRRNQDRYTITAVEWAHKQFVTRVHTLLKFLTQHPKSMNDDKTTIFTHCPRISLPWLTFCFCWWRYNRLVLTSRWPDDCDASTWRVISNLLYINFIHDVARPVV